MSSKPFDELPWWCQLLWPWFGPSWYERVEDLEAYLGAYWCALHLSAAELGELLAADSLPGENYLAKAARLAAARRQAEESINDEYGRLTPDDEVDGELSSAGERPGVVDRDHQSWAEVDAEQRERISGPPGQGGQP